MSVELEYERKYYHVAATKKMSPLDMALEDVRQGRVTTICTPKNGKK